MRGLRSNYLAVIVCGFILLVLGSMAVGVKSVRTWASVGARESLRVESETDKFLFSRDGSVLATIDSDKVVIRDVSSGQKRWLLRGASTALVSGTAYNPDGSRLAVAREDGSLELWDLKSGTLALSLAGHQPASVTALAFSSDGRTIASGGSDARVTLWDAVSGSLRASLLGHRGSVTAIAFSSDGAALASGASDAATIMWDVATGRQLFALSVDAAPSIPSGLVFSRDGKALVGMDREGRVVVWDAGTGAALHRFSGSQGVANSVAFDPAGRALAHGGTNSDAKVWDLTSGDERVSLRSPFGAPLTNVIFSPDGRILATFGADTRIALWDVSAGRLQRVLVGHREWVAALTFGSDASLLVSVGQDGQLIAWDVQSGMQRYAADAPARQDGSLASIGVLGAAAGVSGTATQPVMARAAAQSVTTADSLTGEGATNGGAPNLRAAKAKKKRGTLSRKGMTAIALSPNGVLLGGVSNTGKIEVWNAATGRVRAVFPRDVAFPVSGVAFSADGGRLLSVGKDTVLRAWDIASGKEGRGLQGHEHPIRTVAASAGLLASAGEDTRIMLWDAATGKLTNILSAHLDFVNALAFSRNGKSLASGGADNRVLLWDVQTGKLLHTLRGHGEEVNAVAFSKDGKLLASASEDRRVILWDVATGSQVGALEGHQGPVRAVAFGPDGYSLASAGEDAQIFLWDLQTRRSNKTLRGVTSAINTLAFSTDGATLFTGSEDNAIVQWEVSGGRRGRAFD